MHARSIWAIWVLSRLRAISVLLRLHAIWFVVALCHLNLERLYAIWDFSSASCLLGFDTILCHLNLVWFCAISSGFVPLSIWSGFMPLGAALCLELNLRVLQLRKRPCMLELLPQYDWEIHCLFFLLPIPLDSFPFAVGKRSYDIDPWLLVRRDQLVWTYSYLFFYSQDLFPLRE